MLDREYDLDVELLLDSNIQSACHLCHHQHLCAISVVGDRGKEGRTAKIRRETSKVPVLSHRH